ncbi:MAG: tetratricopeptide repeat protein [Candidatus Falkowbacteria bacterium]
MPVIISLILIGLCLIIILAIILKKFPALAILDINNMPGEKEAKFKDQIIKQKVERDLALVSGRVARVWLFLSRKVSDFLQSSQTQLKKIKLGYKTAAKIPHVEKQKIIKDLFVAYADLLKKEDYNEAEEKLVEIVSLDQKNIGAFFKLGALYDEQKKWSEARQTYQYALKLARQYQDDETIMAELTIQEIYFSLAWVERESDDLDAALENIREALELEPNSPRFLDLILDLSIIKKDKDLAIEYLEKLATVNPENNKLSDWKEKIENL